MLQYKLKSPSGILNVLIILMLAMGWVRSQNVTSGSAAKEDTALASEIATTSMEPTLNPNLPYGGKYFDPILRKFSYDEELEEVPLLNKPECEYYGSSLNKKEESVISELTSSKQSYSGFMQIRSNLVDLIPISDVFFSDFYVYVTLKKTFHLLLVHRTSNVENKFKIVYIQKVEPSHIGINKVHIGKNVQDLLGFSRCQTSAKEICSIRIVLLLTGGSNSPISYNADQNEYNLKELYLEEEVKSINIGKEVNVHTSVDRKDFSFGVVTCRPRNGSTAWTTQSTWSQEPFVKDSTKKPGEGDVSTRSSGIFGDDKTLMYVLLVSLAIVMVLLIIFIVIMCRRCRSKKLAGRYEHSYPHNDFVRNMTWGDIDMSPNDFLPDMEPNEVYGDDGDVEAAGLTNKENVKMRTVSRATGINMSRLYQKVEAGEVDPEAPKIFGSIPYPEHYIPTGSQSQGSDIDVGNSHDVQTHNSGVQHTGTSQVQSCPPPSNFNVSVGMKEDPVDYCDDICTADQMQEVAEIPSQEIHPVSKLLGSEGSFTSVWLGEWLFGGVCQKIVLKCAKEPPSIQSVELLNKQINFFSGLSPHPFIISFIGPTTLKGFPVLVMEYCDAGTLKAYLLQQRARGVFKDTRRIPKALSKLLSRSSYEIASGLDFLHKNQVVHSRLQCRNILMTKDLAVKIKGFGPRGFDNERNDFNLYEESCRWFAPESFLDGVFSRQSDVWMFGVTLWEIFSIGAQPHAARNSIEGVRAAIVAGEPLQLPRHAPADIFNNVVLPCWNMDPRDRPSSKNLVRRLAAYRLQSGNASITSHTFVSTKTANGHEILRPIPSQWGRQAWKKSIGPSAGAAMQRQLNPDGKVPPSVAPKPRGHSSKKALRESLFTPPEISSRGYPPELSVPKGHDMEMNNLNGQHFVEDNRNQDYVDGSVEGRRFYKKGDDRPDSRYMDNQNFPLPPCSPSAVGASTPPANNLSDWYMYK